MTIEHSSETRAPDPQAVQYESVSAGAATLGAVGSVVGLAVASTAAAPVIGFVVGAAAGASLGHYINRIWSSRQPIADY